MSVQQSSLVWQHSKSKHSARLVALAIADFCDDRGRAYPAISTVARKCALSSRATQEAIRELQALGELRIEMNTGPHGVNTYFLTITPANSAPIPLQTLHPPANPAPCKKRTDPLQTLQGGVQIPLITPANFAPDPSGTIKDPSGIVSTAASPISQHHLTIERWMAYSEKRIGSKYHFTPRDAAAVKTLLGHLGTADSIMDFIQRLHQRSGYPFTGSTETLYDIAHNLSRLQGALAAPAGNGKTPDPSLHTKKSKYGW